MVSQGLPEQCEQPASTVANAADSNSNSNSTRSPEHGVEPEDTEPGDRQWDDGGIDAFEVRPGGGYCGSVPLLLDLSLRAVCRQTLGRQARMPRRRVLSKETPGVRTHHGQVPIVGARTPPRQMCARRTERPSGTPKGGGPHLRHSGIGGAPWRLPHPLAHLQRPRQLRGWRRRWRWRRSTPPRRMRPPRWRSRRP